MSLQAIHYLSEKAGRDARYNNREPLTFKNKDVFTFNVAGIPNLGNYIPKGWELVEKLFVDTSGFGRRGEPAMTLEEFKETGYRGPEYGYALIEEGQFQIYVGVFLPTK